jgi:ADP-heptose:LPS heptosyltransferase
LLEIHAVDRNLAITGFLGGKSSTPMFHLPQLPADRLAIETMLQGAEIKDHEQLIALAPWTRSAIKSWPPKRFVDLATELMQWPNVRVVLVGGPSDTSSAEEFEILASQGLVNLVGRLSLRQLPLLLRRMQLLIGNDSAPLHLAAGVGTPVLAIFGPTHPKATGPYPLESHVVFRADLPCSPCGNRRCRNPSYLECLQSISVDQILREVEKILRGFSNGMGNVSFSEHHSRLET